MSDILNFNKARKAKARLDKEKQASANRAKYGMTKEEKRRKKRDTEKLQRHLDGHKRGDDGPQE